ncbi:hypothetical protein EJB05_12017, partial [Eragrostis curvula]
MVAGRANVIGIFSPATFAERPCSFRGVLTRANRSHSAAACHDASRLASLSAAGSGTSSFQTQVENGAGAYLINLSIGRPQLAFPVILDTGSDHTWTHAGPFRACETGYGCAYDYHYTVGYTAGYLAADTLALGGASVPGVAFGCSTANDGPMDGALGILGLGRDALSLGSQLRSDADAGASPILFGSAANVTGDTVQSTPLVASDPFGFTATGAGGLIVDSGTTITYLAEAGYAMVRHAFLSQTAGLTRVSGAPFSFDLCFAAAAPSTRCPFRGLFCALLAVRSTSCRGRATSTPWTSMAARRVCCFSPPKVVSVIGNVIQMDLHVLYDLDDGMLSFVPMDCASA